MSRRHKTDNSSLVRRRGPTATLLQDIAGIRWIVFEGIDGAGKTTQAKMLCESLARIGVNTLYKHVFDTDLGRQLRELFLSSVPRDLWAEVFVLLATRAQFIADYLNDSAQSDTLLISDRFFYSITSMQGRVDSGVLPVIKSMERAMTRAVRPDVTVYLDVPATVALTRLSAAKPDRIESMPSEFHEKVRNAFREDIDNRHDTVIVDGNQDITRVHRAVQRSLRCWLGEKAASNQPEISAMS
jgi:dTMP kinase